MIDPKQHDIGRHVLYAPEDDWGAYEGSIMSFNDNYVFVQIASQTYALRRNQLVWKDDRFTLAAWRKGKR